MFPRSPKCSPEVQNVPRPLVAVVTAFRDSALIGIQKIDNFKGHFFNLLEYLQDYPLFFRIFQAIPGEARQEEHRLADLDMATLALKTSDHRTANQLFYDSHKL